MRRILSIQPRKTFTERPTQKLIWAQNAESSSQPTDPDKDTTHYIYKPDRYESIGWQSGEKPPEQWQNFLQHITDLKLKEGMTNGILCWYEDVSYKSGALCSFNNLIYKSMSEGNSGNMPDESDQWELVFTILQDTYTDSLSGLVELVEKHVASTGEDNPHEDHITPIGGYTIKEVDNMLSASGSNTMAAHILNYNNPHKLTCKQLNVLPASEGGTFRGVVTFAGGILIGDGYIGWK
ncbi:hypothetical protein EHW66_17950 [Erwinia psidii]|uniref:hypothetical protein n=1 Tax=Erwinia psidii TaxID=69224 RepID=UPI00226B7008|nr:hypothetical protein [Erwinia psidii]MCX8966797.1 hypothetical protein [Erwinia psidii]